MTDTRESQADLDPPEPTGADRAHSVVRAGLSSLPVVGGAATELFMALVAPPLEKRRGEWMESVGQTLQELADVQAIDLDSLRDDPEFIDTMLQAANAALRTSQAEKRTALRNAVVNSALPGAPEMDLRSVFLRLVNDLSPTHLRIMKISNDPLPALEESGALASFSRRGGTVSFSQVVEGALSDLIGTPWALFGRHLTTEGLLEDSDSHRDSLYAALLPYTTQLGRQFLDFVHVKRDFGDPSALVTSAAALEELRSELFARGRSSRFEVGPIQRIVIAPDRDPIVTAIAVLFPREAARRPVANGNPPSLAEARLSVIGDSVVDVFSDGADPELVGTEQLDLRLDAGFNMSGESYPSASRTADALIERLENVFPNRRYWPARR